MRFLIFALLLSVSLGQSLNFTVDNTLIVNNQIMSVREGKDFVFRCVTDIPGGLVVVTTNSSINVFGVPCAGSDIDNLQ